MTNILQDSISKVGYFFCSSFSEFRNKVRAFFLGHAINGIWSSVLFRKECRPLKVNSFIDRFHYPTLIILIFNILRGFKDWHFDRQSIFSVVINPFFTKFYAFFKCMCVSVNSILICHYKSSPSSM